MRQFSARDYFEIGLRHHGNHETRLALQAYFEAAKLEPKQPAIRANIGLVYAEIGKIEEARAAYDQAAKLVPKSNAKYEFKKVLLQPTIFDSSSQILEERSRLTKGIHRLNRQNLRLTNPQNEVGNPAFFLAYQGLNNREIQMDIANTLAKACPLLRYKASHHSQVNRKRIRVAFFSANFFDHTVGHVNLGLIKNLPRDQFEVILIRPGGHQDQVTQRITSAADSSMIVSNSFQDARLQIEQAELDILLFTDIGMEDLSYYLAFSRLAPVQAALWGHPDTTGISSIDYYISTSSFEPDDGQKAYSERLIRLPRHYICFDPPRDPVRNIATETFRASNSEKIYLCPQSLFKLHPDTDELFDCLLKTDRKGVICLPLGPHDNWVERLRLRFAKSCPDTWERIRFIPRISSAQFRNALFSADAIIDPMHFTGGYTSYLGLSVGTPIVTMPGEYLPSRMTAGLYKQMGIDSLTATDPTSYAEIAVRVANDLDWRRDRSDQIRDAGSSIFGDKESVQIFSECLRLIHESAQKGTLLPQGIF